MISDLQILEWIKEKIIRIENINQRDPTLIFFGRVINAELNGQAGRNRIKNNCYRYRFTLYFRGKRRRIMRAKLVWMVKHEQTVPDGHVIHHSDEDRFNDAWSNLDCITNEEHETIHYEQI